jgi:hypothetical protein
MPEEEGGRLAVVEAESSGDAPSHESRRVGLT